MTLKQKYDKRGTHYQASKLLKLASEMIVNPAMPPMLLQQQFSCMMQQLNVII